MKKISEKKAYGYCFVFMAVMALLCFINYDQLLEIESPSAVGVAYMGIMCAIVAVVFLIAERATKEQPKKIVHKLYTEEEWKNIDKYSNL